MARAGGTAVGNEGVEVAGMDLGDIACVKVEELELDQNWKEETR